MSVVKLDAEPVICSMVEAMLPRFSDSKLGLLLGIDMHIYDLGYGKDGNTKERKEKNVRRFLYFLFVRSSNYTKVFFWEPSKDKSRYPCAIEEWYLICDHDSCWRGSFGSKLTDIYFDSCKKFDGRKRSGEEMTWNDLSQYITLEDPKYVRLETYEQKNKQADRFSYEGRVWTIESHTIDFSCLEKLISPDGQWMANSGLLIKGSEIHKQYLESLEIRKKTH